MTTLNWEKAAQRAKIAKNGYCDIRRLDKKPPHSLNAMRVELANLLRKKHLNAGQRKRMKALRRRLK